MITTTAPTAADILNLGLQDETVLYNPQGDFFIKSQSNFLFVSFIVDFSKMVLEEIVKARTNVGLNSSIIASRCYSHRSVNHSNRILGKL